MNELNMMIFNKILLNLYLFVYNANKFKFLIFFLVFVLFSFEKESNKIVKIRKY
jgi:hypothetical protein